MRKHIISSLICIATAAGFIFYSDLHLYFRAIPEDLDKAIVQQMEAAKLPGSSVLIFNKQGIVFSKGFGFSNIEKQQSASPDTLYRVASVSKLVTATAVMLLVEQGKINLDGDVSAYLPFEIRHPKHLDDNITFRMLLTHTSGISDGIFLWKGAYWDMYEVVDNPSLETESLATFLEKYFTPNEAFYDADVNFNDSSPGTEFEYSNVAFGLLGYLVEQISGLPFETFCKEEVFMPLQMNSTQWFSDKADKSRRAMPYQYSMLSNAYKPVGFYDISTYPDGGLITSTAEFMNFLYVFINKGKTRDGRTFLDENTVVEMLRSQHPEISPILSIAWANVYGKHMHGGTDPGVKAFVMISADEQWGALMFSNGGAFRTELGFEIRDDFYSFVNRRNFSVKETNLSQGKGITH